MLTLKNISKRYGAYQALKDFSLEAKGFEIHGILGHNGCGKSTLFKSIMGLNNLDAGEILLEGERLQTHQRSRFGYMPEQRAMLLDLTVIEHARLLGSLRHLSEHDIVSQVDRYARKLHLLDKLHQRIKNLSKGQQQKTQLLLTLMHQPKVLILDEPLNGLDFNSVTIFMNLLLETCSEGACILISAHQMDFMDELCTHLTILDKGVVLRQGSVRELQKHQSIRIRLNADSAWQGVSYQAQWIEDQGNMIELYYENVELAKVALKQFANVKSIRSLAMQPTSIGSYLKEER